jgi:hypothetical protein
LGRLNLILGGLGRKEITKKLRKLREKITELATLTLGKHKNRGGSRILTLNVFLGKQKDRDVGKPMDWDRRRKSVQRTKNVISKAKWDDNFKNMLWRRPLEKQHPKHRIDIITNA